MASFDITGMQLPIRKHTAAYTSFVRERSAIKISVPQKIDLRHIHLVSIYISNQHHSIKFKVFFEFQIIKIMSMYIIYVHVVDALRIFSVNDNIYHIHVHVYQLKTMKRSGQHNS